MNASRTGLRRAEDGHSLPAVLVALTVGLLLVTPLLSGGSTSLLATRAADQSLLEQYAIDAGIEYGVWKLRYDATFRASVDAVPLTPVSVLPAISLNGFSPSTTAMALSAPGWGSLDDAWGDVEQGGALTFGGGDDLFALGGGDTRAFWRYSLSTEDWEARANTPDRVREGGALTWNGGSYVYAFRGRNSQGFWRYNGTTWAQMRQAPDSVRWGGSLAYANGSVYALRGRGTDDFWCYTPPPPGTLGVWNCGGSDPPDPSAIFEEGAALVYAGSNVFYALEGKGSRGFWRYVSTGGGTWSSLMDTLDDVDVGGALAYTGGDYVYAFYGGGTAGFWRYSISGNSWTPDTDAPAAVSDGGALTYAGGDYIYALRGGGYRDFWRFRVAPPQYDIVSQSGSRTITARIEIDGSTVTVLFWDIQ